MKNNIQIIKPIGVSTKNLLSVIKKDLGIKNLYLLNDLDADFFGIVVFYFDKNNLNKINKRKINNKYLIKLELKNIDLFTKKIKDKFNKSINKIIVKKNNSDDNLIDLEIIVNSNFKITNILNLKEIKKIISVERTKNYLFNSKEAININDLWKYRKNVFILNQKNKINFKTFNLLIGEFDLIHKGHKILLNNKNISILTFLNNPSKKNTILDINARIKNLNKYNPKKIFVFDIQSENIPANYFIDKYLKKINPENIYVGSDFKFGKKALGNINLLKKHFNVVEINKNKNFSVTNVKKLLMENNFKTINSILDKDFYFEGIIIKGKQLGRKLGFPTANTYVNSSFPFNCGSYVTKSFVNNEWYDSISFIKKENDKYLLETHIFNFNKDIYGKNIKTIPLSFIREAQKFTNINDLVKSIKNDIKISKNERIKYGK